MKYYKSMKNMYVDYKGDYTYSDYNYLYSYIMIQV